MISTRDTFDTWLDTHPEAKACRLYTGGNEFLVTGSCVLMTQAHVTMENIMTYRDRAPRPISNPANVFPEAVFSNRFRIPDNIYASMFLPTDKKGIRAFVATGDRLLGLQGFKSDSGSYDFTVIHDLTACTEQAVIKRLGFRYYEIPDTYVWPDNCDAYLAVNNAVGYLMFVLTDRGTYDMLYTISAVHSTCVENKITFPDNTVMRLERWNDKELCYMATAKIPSIPGRPSHLAKIKPDAKIMAEPVPAAVPQATESGSPAADPVPIEPVTTQETETDSITAEESARAANAVLDAGRHCGTVALDPLETPIPYTPDKQEEDAVYREIGPETAAAAETPSTTTVKKTKRDRKAEGDIGDLTSITEQIGAAVPAGMPLEDAMREVRQLRDLIMAADRRMANIALGVCEQSQKTESAMSAIRAAVELK